MVHIQISYNKVPMWLLQVEVLLRVLSGNFAATRCTAASVTVASEYSHSTLKDTLICINNLCNSAIQSEEIIFISRE